MVDVELVKMNKKTVSANLVEQYLFYPSRMFRFQLLQKSSLGLGYGTAEVTAKTDFKGLPKPQTPQVPGQNYQQIEEYGETSLDISGSNPKSTFAQCLQYLGT